MSKKRVNIAVGDPTVIRQMCTHLTRAYEEFVNSFDGDLTFVEGVMGVHNFHVYMIEDLVSRSGKDIWRQVAKDTFAGRMDNPGQFDTKVGWEE